MPAAPPPSASRRYATHTRRPPHAPDADPRCPLPLLPTEHPLFAEILARPTDPGPRLVLADALIERGEPYGEYLHLANGGSRAMAVRSREKVLREGVTRAFLGPLDAMLLTRDRTWRAGLLHSAGIKPVPADVLEACADDPLWGTLVELRVAGALQDTGPMLGWVTDRAPWRWLEAVSVAGPAHARGLFRGPDLPITRLHGAFLTPDDLATLADTRIFPQLRELTSEVVPLTPAHADARVRTAHTRGYDVLGFGLHPASFAHLVGLAQGSAVTTLRFEDASWRLEADPRTWTWRATPRAKDAAASTVHGLLRRLDKRFHQGVTFP